MTQDPALVPQSPWRRSATTARRVSERLSTVIFRHSVIAFVVIQFFAITILQKFAIQFSFTVFGFYISVGSVQVALPIFYLGILLLIVTGKVKVDLVRLALFTALTASIAISIFLQRNLFSVPSVMLAVACYAPFILKIDVSAILYRKIVSIYINIMLIVSAIVIAQHVVQIIWSWKLWPDLDKLVSPEFLLAGFNYIQPIVYGSRLMKPNAVFFLEVSTVSQFIAVAFALEVIYFKRIWRMAFLIFVLLSTFAGTGPLLLVLCAPILLWKLSPRSIGAVLIVFAIGYVAAERIQWYQQVQGRFTEYERQNSSASKRFVDPFDALLELTQRGDAVLTGIGPGNTAKNDGTVSWAVTKVSVEYGVLTAVLFMLFVGYVLFKDAPSSRAAFMLLVFFNFMGGGIVIPIYPIMIFLFGGLFRIEKSRSRRRPDPEGERRRSSAHAELSARAQKDFEMSWASPGAPGLRAGSRTGVQDL